MNIERLWRKEHNRRIKNELRRQRIRLNWPLHAELVVDVFREFQRAAERDGVRLKVQELTAASSDPRGLQSEFELGWSSVTLSFSGRRTGCGVLTRTPECVKLDWDYEPGTALSIQYSADICAVEVFLSAPTSDGNEDERNHVAIDYTYDTDDITRAWICRQIGKLLVFNRVESILEKSGALDQLRVRWWRFMDIRNRKGYLEKPQHILTPWELVVIAAVAALPVMALIKWVLDQVLKPIILP